MLPHFLLTMLLLPVVLGGSHHLPQLLARDDGCFSSEVACGDGCIPEGAVCCTDSGGYCDPGYQCATHILDGSNTCCPDNVDFCEAPTGTQTVVLVPVSTVSAMGTTNPTAPASITSPAVPAPTTTSAGGAPTTTSVAAPIPNNAADGDHIIGQQVYVLALVAAGQLLL
jgi:hypothetical protein